MGGSVARWALGALTGIMMSAAFAGHASAATVIADSPTVVVGQNVTFTVSENVADLIAFDIGINYDPALLQILGATIGADVPPPMFADLNTSTPGAAVLSVFGCCTGSTGDLDMFTVTFSALSAGTATVDVTTFGDPMSGSPSVYYMNITGAAVPIGGFGSTTITGGASAIPEPATWAMLILGFGIAGAAIRSGRRQALAHA